MTDYKIFTNLAGFQPHGLRKTAVLTSPATRFSLVDRSGKVCFEGDVKRFGFDECSGDEVYIADFSEFSAEGEYHVEADNNQRSADFRISANVYDSVLHDTAKVFYFMRCGCALNEKYAGKFTHQKCHTAPALLWDDHNTACDVSGGWHDAGDYGRYVTPGAVAAAQLLYAYIMFPKSFDTLNLDIPESDGSLPDILAEVKVELDWIMKMQRDDGAVYHKATAQHHAPFNMMPEDDNDTIYLLPISSVATADTAAVTALAARVFRPFDKEYADKLLFAAKKSAQWLECHPDYLFINRHDCHTGAYGEREDKDNRFWAWSELFCTTGDMHYHDLMKSELNGAGFMLTQFGYASVGGFGALAYILCAEGADPELREYMKKEIIGGAYYFRDMANKSGYGAAMDMNSYGWGSNMSLLQRAMLFIAADYISDEEIFAAYAEQQLNVLLGHNALGFSFVSGTGENCLKHPHYRPTASDGIDECIPGFVSGGANSSPADEAGKAAIPENTPPMKCYIDYDGAYSLNEVAIYWNSPAVFLLAYLFDRKN